MISGAQLRDSIISGANNITNLKDRVDELNVFPVPDGDTGTNMSMTINSALPELINLPDDCTVEQSSAVAASALLRGARGNSGVILSLLFRGFAKMLIGKTEADSKDIYNSLHKGVDSAYKAVMKPTEGTMLTVGRVAAEKAAEVYADRDPVELWTYIVEIAEQTLQQTPEMLPVLKKAGVVDSGGQGLVYIFEGMLKTLRDGEIVQPNAETGTMAEFGKGVFSEQVDPETTNCYCTEFLVMKCADKKADAEKLRAYLEKYGESVVVVDDDELIKCHVHTADPGQMLSAALKHGYLSKLKIENMLEQYLARQSEGKKARLDSAPPTLNPQFPYALADPSCEYGFVAVSSGDGLETLFKDLGVDRVVSGGQTMNPSTDDVLSAIQSIPAKNIIVLANNQNIMMASEQACTLADRKAVVLTARTIPQGISAMLAFNPEATLSENIIAMNSASENVSTGLVTFAARDSDFDGRELHEGEVLGMSGGKLIITEKDITKAVVKLTKKLVKKTTDFVTLIYGSDVTETDANAAADQVRETISSDIEVTLVYGGQPVYYYYISVE
ncbi:MAG: DAK2 domain-containing protein [Oscillospiraceae bacterium]